MLLKTFCALTILALSLTNAEKQVLIKREGNHISSFGESLSDVPTIFTCETEIEEAIFNWYIGDEKLPSSKASSNSAELEIKLEPKHYQKQLKCEAVYKDDTTKFAQVPLYMKCKFLAILIQR